MSRKFQLKKLSSLTWKVIGTSACQIRESLEVAIKEKDEKIASLMNERYASTFPHCSIRSTEYL